MFGSQLKKHSWLWIIFPNLEYNWLFDRDRRTWPVHKRSKCSFTEVAGGFSCPSGDEVRNSGSFSRHAHPEDCRKYYICLEGQAREYGCPIGTVFKIGDSDGTGNCEDPEDVPGW